MEDIAEGFCSSFAMEVVDLYQERKGGEEKTMFVRNKIGANLNRNTTWLMLAFVLLLGFALRAGYCFQIKASPFFEPGAGVDQYLYDTWAQRIAGGDWVGHEVFWAAPGYPYFLGIIYSLFGRDLLWVRLIQAFLGTCSCFLIFLIARQRLGALPGLIAAFFAATYQMFIFHDGMLVGSTLSVFLNSLGLYVLATALEKRQRGRFILSGLILGAAVLTGASTILFVLIVAVWLAWRRQVSFSLILLATVLLTILPVTVRNYVVADDLVPIAAHGGINFYIGNNPSASGVYEPPKLMLSSSIGLIQDSQTFAKKETGRALKPSEVSRYWFQKGLSFIKNDPWRYSTLTIRKAGLFMNATELTDILNVDITRQYCPVLRLPLVRFGWLFPLAMIGIFASWPLLKGNRLLFFFLVAQLISCCLYFVNARYRLPSVIAFSVFAGYAVFWFIENISERRFPRVIMAVLAGSAISVITYLPLHRQDNVVDIYNLALAHQRKGGFKEAERLLQECVRLSPNFDDGYYALGYLCWQRGRREEAALFYKKALLKNPDFAEARYNLGCLYSEDGELDEAQRQFEMALSVKPDHRGALNNLSSVCARRKDFELAQQCWRKVLEFDPDNAMARQETGSSGKPPPGQ